MILIWSSFLTSKIGLIKMKKVILRNIKGTLYSLTCSRKSTMLMAGPHITVRWELKEFGASVGVSLLGASAVRKYIALGDT
jgi:hypothetical protein